MDYPPEVVARAVASALASGRELLESPGERKRCTDTVC